MHCKDLNTLYEKALVAEEEQKRQQKIKRRLDSFRLHYFKKLKKAQYFNLISPPIGFFKNKCPLCKNKLTRSSSVLWDSLLLGLKCHNTYYVNYTCKCGYQFIKNEKIKG